MKNLASWSLALAGSVLLQLAACAPKDEKPTAEIDPFAVVSEKLTFKVDTLFTEFESPWGMTWLPDGRMLVVERKGEILVFKNDKFTGEKLTGVPEVHEVNQAGLLDIALHPDFANNGWLYLAFARPQGEGDQQLPPRYSLRPRTAGGLLQGLYPSGIRVR